jgi:hypothetical protein
MMYGVAAIATPAHGSSIRFSMKHDADTPIAQDVFSALCRISVYTHLNGTQDVDPVHMR